MAKYRKRPLVVEASQGFKNGDHPGDYLEVRYRVQNPATGAWESTDPRTRKEKGEEGDVVRFYRNPYDDGQRECDACGHPMHDHGWIDSGGAGQIVCPGDWVITEVAHKYHIIPSDDFPHFYEPIEE